jgi:hypothetical protein
LNIGMLCIANREADYRPGMFENLLRIYPFVSVAGEVCHFPMAPGLEPIFEPLSAMWRCGGGKSAIVEAEFHGGVSDLFFHRVVCSRARRN